MNWSFLNLLPFLAPALLTAAHVPPRLVPAITNGMVEAQHLYEAGADKKAHVLNIASTAIESINAEGSHQLDSELTIAAIDKGINATISAIHAFRGAK